MTKVVYNSCYGGFSLSEAGLRRYAEMKGLPFHVERGQHRYLDAYWAGDQSLTSRDFDRTDPTLVRVVEELGAAASGPHAALAIRDVPAGTRYRIDPSTTTTGRKPDMEWLILAGWLYWAFMDRTPLLRASARLADRVRRGA
jgi:hypothetical protein